MSITKLMKSRYIKKLNSKLEINNIIAPRNKFKSRTKNAVRASADVGAWIMRLKKISLL